MLNVAAIMGRLVADPELKTTPAGVHLCRFRLACERSYARPGEQRQADFLDVVAWRQTAEFVSKYFKKGSLIAVQGSVQSRQYQDKNGANRTAVEIAASSVSFAGGKKEAAPRDFEQQTQDYAAAASAPALAGAELYPGESLADYPPPGQRPQQPPEDGLDRLIEETAADDLPF